MKIISGGQTGADQAGLHAAYNNGVETGGFAPAHYLTKEGNDFNLRDKFHLVEIQGGYRKRTWMNVDAADCTLRFAFNFKSPGEICTFNAIKHYNKPYMDFDLNYLITNPMIKDLGDWIIEQKHEVINIAGNAQNILNAFTPTYEAVDRLLKYIKKISIDKSVK